MIRIRQSGLYSYGRGVFPKPPIEGTITSASTLFRVRGGQFIYSKLFAFEGAFAVVPDEMDGWFVSNRVPPLRHRHSRVRTDFLALTICRPSAWRGLATMTVGMGHRRQRLQPNAFLDYEVALPSLAEQKAIVDAASIVDRGLKGARGSGEAALQFLRALREERLVQGDTWRRDAGWVHATLDQVADVALGFTKGRKLTGPTKDVAVSSRRERPGRVHRARRRRLDRSERCGPRQVLSRCGRRTAPRRVWKPESRRPRMDLGWFDRAVSAPEQHVASSRSRP